MRVKGLILAGGEGKRIGGKKPLRLLSGKPLIFWALRPYLEEDLEVYISVKEKNQEEEIKEALLREKISLDKIWFLLDDPFCKGKGPLGGLFSGMKACQELTYLLVSAVDQPFLTREIFKPLLEKAISLSSKACVYKVDGKIEPLPGVYSSELSEILKNFLLFSSKPSFKAFLDYLHSQNLVVFLDYVTKIKKEGSPFFNINFLEDLMAAEDVFFTRKI